MEPRQLAKYPYLRAATEHVRALEVTLEDLLTHPAYSEARRRGKRRVVEAVENAYLTNRPVTSEEEALQEILSYPVARILVSCVADESLIRRYALAEAKTMSDRLQTEDVSFLQEMAEHLEVSARFDGERLRMHFADFLRYTSGLRGKEWKLVNQEVKEGDIVLSKSRFARVLEQALQEKVEDELPLPVTDAILDAVEPDLIEVREMVARMQERLRENDFGEITITRFPPCMKHLMAMAEKGQNMPHAGRFALVTFLSTLGMGSEQIVRTFYTSPDFDNSMTTYQVRHITGDGMGRRYSCPECATMRTNGLCVDMDALCQSGKVRHPLGYYRMKSRERMRSAPPPKATDEKKEK